MALRYLDGMELYDSSGDRTALDGNYDFTANVDAADAGLTSGRVNGRAAFNQEANSITIASGEQLPLLGFTTDTTQIHGFAFRCADPEFLNSVNARRTTVFQVQDADDDPLFTVYARAGTLQVRSGDEEGTQLGVANVSIVARVWWFIEIKFTLHASTGSVEIRVHEDTVLSLTNVNTDPNGTTIAAQAEYGKSGRTSIGDAARCEIDHLYICDSVDGTGLSPAQAAANNDYLGDIGGKRIDADGDGSTTEFDTSTGSTHYTLIDEADPNDDTDYVESQTSGQVDLFTFGSLPNTPAQIEAVAVESWAKKTDSGTRSSAHRVRSSATNQDMVTVEQLTTDYRRLHSIFTTDPNTSSRWGEAGVNALEAGPKVNS